ncbi:type IV pili methyl-accepting chemotaxis transducer N-terminal domain-containing protein [Hydrogenophaga sp.]|uniref:type IV pili methyl-accepting chemotaxis transducer N-terminal domain-containing protein n=1 Tax=Hydrogenophaga sp. TaxID=1904254 RepID=UPI00272F471A|nr:type IV pili methyl-accepting chemotaxis transducer N-terminal domain-containing protein [Hydrogenophaga sp.]MDP2018307.1 type IV pili methyl-accepting chemotaxis transducer N-terminal domain-containing protein [Hydrogenophaga sp.]MDP3811757.1 type IV pili methyl-accepting chemotaxis transducer N-terminal domain-containing protein [Hydrogenophaga sp.]
MTSLATPTTAFMRNDTPAHIAGLSLVNLAARQRMLSQRMVLQTVLAANGDAERLQAAQRSLKMFTESQQHLLTTAAQLEPASARKIIDIYQGTRGVGPVVQAFMQLARNALDQIEAASPRLSATTAELVGHTDRILEALNTATTAFDEVARLRSDAMMKELAGIVGDIQSVAKEAKVVSFNAQVMAARAGQHGREFAVVANVLSDITGEIDRLTRKAAMLAERSRNAG